MRLIRSTPGRCEQIAFRLRAQQIFILSSVCIWQSSRNAKKSHRLFYVTTFSGQINNCWVRVERILHLLIARTTAIWWLHDGLLNTIRVISFVPKKIHWQSNYKRYSLSSIPKLIGRLEEDTVILAELRQRSAKATKSCVLGQQKKAAAKYYQNVWKHFSNNAYGRDFVLDGRCIWNETCFTAQSKAEKNMHRRYERSRSTSITVDNFLAVITLNTRSQFENARTAEIMPKETWQKSLWPVHKREIDATKTVADT